MVVLIARSLARLPDRCLRYYIRVPRLALGWLDMRRVDVAGTSTTRRVSTIALISLCTLTDDTAISVRCVRILCDVSGAAAPGGVQFGHAELPSLGFARVETCQVGSSEEKTCRSEKIGKEKKG